MSDKLQTRSLPLGDCKGNAFMSTIVAKGRGKGLVVRTGNDTEVRNLVIIEKLKKFNKLLSYS